jgi:hypothetical protein
MLIMREGPFNFLPPTKEKCARCRTVPLYPQKLNIQTESPCRNQLPGKHSVWTDNVPTFKITLNSKLFRISL